MATTALSVLTLLLTFWYIGIVIYLRQGWRKLPGFNNFLEEPAVSVSIIIAARNEEGKLEKTIVDILNQRYPKSLLQLIVVDDHSTDRTAAIVRTFANDGVQLLSLNEDRPLNSYKKKAIAEAIKIATGELIVTTDADCRMGPFWLNSIANFYKQYGFKMISSPVAFFEEKNAFEEMQTLEFLYLIGLGAATIGQKAPSTCNGANLAYRKDVFNEVNGFYGIDDLASGDDELLLHKVAAAYPKGIGFCKSKDAMVYTHAKPNLQSFIRQRKRWASKSTRYKNKGIVALGVSLWLFNALFLINAVCGFFNPVYFWLAALSLSGKFLAELYFLIPMCRFAGRERLLWYQPLLTVLHIFYFVYIGLAGNSGKYRWKGRMVR